MISKIDGRIDLLTEKFVIVNVSGIGYKVSVSPETLIAIKNKPARHASQGDAGGEKISLWTHLHVKEDALDLYGFIDRSELEFFEMLIGISGIGPKSALGVIGVAPIETLKKAIASGDTSYLTKISGIGKKTAEKIILELRDKLSAQGHKAEAGELSEELDAALALQTLGYSQTEAREALKKVSPDSTDINTRIKEALRVLGGKTTS